MTIQEQKNILDHCMANDIALDEELVRRGYTYDDLRYESYSSKVALDAGANAAEPIEAVHRFHDGIPAISFFSGAGGLDIGFELAGFHTLASVELEEIFCNTQRLNWPDKPVIGPPLYSGNVKRHEEIAEALRVETGIGFGFRGIFHGGPPCQPFSIAANQRYNKNGENFKRRGFDDEDKGNLLFDYLWYIETFRPLGFLIENVEGLVELDGDGRIALSLARLRGMGYSISAPQVINATFYGVPQNRKRCIIMGVLGDILPQLPTPSILPTSCKAVFERPLDNVGNHVTRKHSAASVLRYMKLAYGQRDHLGRVDRLDPNAPSKTVIAGGTKGGGRSHLHPYIPRTLSVRECARLQTFPDDYVFTGSNARQFTQVGNAVPPLLAYRLALALKESLRQNHLLQEENHPHYGLG